MPEMKIIAHIRTPFKTKFGIPRQSGVAPQVRGEIVFEPEYRVPDAVRGIDGYSHLWLLWMFSESVTDKWSPTAPAEARRKCAHGRFRHSVAVSPEPHRAFVGGA